MGGYKIVYLYEWGNKMEKSEKGEDECEVAGPFLGNFGVKLYNLIGS